MWLATLSFQVPLVMLSLLTFIRRFYLVQESLDHTVVASKIVEKIVYTRLKLHCAESALIRVFKDILAHLTQWTTGF